jgi:hypothetical protein
MFVAGNIVFNNPSLTREIGSVMANLRDPQQFWAK